VKNVLEILGCLQWLWDGALPTRPMDRGKRPYASRRGSQTLIMGKLKIVFKPQRRNNQNLRAALNGNGVFIFFPHPGSCPAQGLSPHSCAQHVQPRGRGCPVQILTPEGQEQPWAQCWGTAWGWLGALCPGDCIAVVWPRGDEVMNNLSQVVICQDEVESACQLGMTENIIHGRSHVRAIQKYSKNQNAIC